jgi:hypothetical protein
MATGEGNITCNCGIAFKVTGGTAVPFYKSIIDSANALTKTFCATTLKGTIVTSIEKDAESVYTCSFTAKTTDSCLSANKSFKDALNSITGLAADVGVSCAQK